MLHSTVKEIAPNERFSFGDVDEHIIHAYHYQIVTSKIQYAPWNTNKLEQIVPRSLIWFVKIFSPSLRPGVAQNYLYFLRLSKVTSGNLYCKLELRFS